jgi:hypothetical protein
LPWTISVGPGPLPTGSRNLDWVQRLDQLARAVNPLLLELFAPMTYYWVTAVSAGRLCAHPLPGL